MPPTPAPAQLHVGTIDRAAAARIRAAARARGLTLGEYLARLEAYHAASRTLAARAGQGALSALLSEHGLETVTH